MATVAGASIDYGGLIKEDAERFLLHGSVYTDPNIFAEEMEKIFHRGWVYLGHESEVPKSGDYRLKWIGLQSVMMTRGEDGRVLC